MPSTVCLQIIKLLETVFNFITAWENIYMHILHLLFGLELMIFFEPNLRRPLLVTDIM